MTYLVALVHYSFTYSLIQGVAFAAMFWVVCVFYLHIYYCNELQSETEKAAHKALELVEILQSSTTLYIRRRGCDNHSILVICEFCAEKELVFFAWYRRFYWISFLLGQVVDFGAIFYCFYIILSEMINKSSLTFNMVIAGVIVVLITLIWVHYIYQVALRKPDLSLSRSGSVSERIMKAKMTSNVYLIMNIRIQCKSHYERLQVQSR